MVWRICWSILCSSVPRTSQRGTGGMEYGGYGGYGGYGLGKMLTLAHMDRH